ncbi:5' nucleotidase, NT5C type [Sphingomonas humi]|uniref:5' nucleotidase, NT5C type n=1 Tax=Sphingomonas humi TaxID=335630 RepID=UPI0031E47E1C
MSEPKLFLDCDGVLADFDAGVRDLLGTDARSFEARHGRGEFWKRLARHGDFYASLPKMADADELFDAVRHLEPTILTGLPIGQWAAPQKVRWAAEHFPGVPIITCMARDKHRHMQGADVLVDDSERHLAAWEAAGGIYVLHRSARESIARLAEIYPSVGKRS